VLDDGEPYPNARFAASHSSAPSSPPARSPTSASSSSSSPLTAPRAGRGRSTPPYRTGGRPSPGCAARSTHRRSPFACLSWT
jgi:hypothetical protein